MNWVLVGVFAYVVAQFVIGVVVSRRIKNEDDYLLAGRSFGYGLATFSIFATWFGAETCIGAAGRFYQDGLSGGATDPFGYTACLLVMGLVFALPLYRRKLTTLADLFRQRYSPGVERVAVLLMAPTSIFWAAAQIRAFGHLVEATSGVGAQTATGIAAAVVIAYTFTGGLRADVLTDFVQGIAIIVGLGILVTVIAWEPGTLANAWQAVSPERMRLFGGADTSVWRVIEAWAVPICGSVVAQELVARVISAKSPQVAQRATLLGAGMYLTVGLLPAFLGLIGLTLLPGLEEPEQFLPLLAQKHLHTALYVVFVGGLISAILSTVDSTLLAASAVVSHNLIVPLRPGMSDAAKVRAARVGVIVGGVIAYGLALSAETVYELVETASAFGSAGIFVVMVFALFSGYGGPRAALASLVTGTGVWLYGTFVGEWDYPYLISLGTALAAYFIAGCFDKREAPISDPARSS
jgi:SSS family solute:Na+ symporter